MYCGLLSQLDSALTDGNFVNSCNAFDFQDSCLFINYWSTIFSGLASTGTASVSFGHYTFTGDVTLEVNVFSVAGSDWATVASLTINSGPGTFVIININGGSDGFTSFRTTLQGGIDAQHVIYNFYQATSLTVSSISVEVCMCYQFLMVF